jgi:hypothetical protein
MKVLRRFLVVAALMFWQGGFTFYAGVVVPVGRQVLGAEQSRVTQPVTHYLNLAGAFALLPIAWDLVLCPAANWRSRARWAMWVGMLVTLALLGWLHVPMERHMNGSAPLEPGAFHLMHRFYLWISTVQWGCAIMYAVLTLGAWREEDRQEGSAKKVPPLASSASPSHRSCHAAEQRV